MTEQPTRGEFELLKQIVTANQTRLDSIDNIGTRGVGVVQAQLVEVVKDLADLKADVNKRFDDHQRVHEQDLRDRVSGRRWLTGTLIAAIVMLVAILGLAINIASNGRL